eukprot:TRINITY_DN7364_c0_g1_i1.p1 TRINITY_DN7364_c0_g1~~TRINITY_DN7364_c0_g1_i1.p1  ORF type:complete len:267 (-),score=37.20 TRINITY_DN7364_c0_g1_i1:396-1196(-)
MKKGFNLRNLWAVTVGLIVITTLSFYLLGRALPAANSTLLQFWLTSFGMSELQSPSLKCSNTLQGRKYITDERAYTCLREEVDFGCCANRENRYSCNTCDSTLQCCSEFEFCVSCCMSPSQAPVVQAILKRRNTKDTGNSNILLKSAKTPFEFCVAKCRTSSRSVVFENQYRSNELKFCYGNQDPPLSEGSGAAQSLYQMKVTKAQIESQDELTTDASSQQLNDLWNADAFEAVADSEINPSGRPGFGWLLWTCLIGVITLWFMYN